MTGGRGIPEAIGHRRGHRTQMALPSKHLAEGIGDMYDPDVGGLNLGRGQRARDHLSG